MELLGERPAWSMSGGEALTTLDAVDAEIARLQSCRLPLVARVDDTGHAQELGARDTVELLAFRYRMDHAEAYRDVRLARALPKYSSVSAGLTHGIDIPGSWSGDSESGDREADAGSHIDGGPDGQAGADAGGAGVRVLRPVQAQVIVSALERVRSRVPLEDLDVAEQQLVNLAAHLCPKELRTVAKEICDLLDSDGPEPDEQKAYARESLTLTTAEHGVKFRGYLANENAELLRSVVHAGARPHKTIDGELDPRSREKRQADALTTALIVAATATDAGLTAPTGGSPSATSGSPSAGDAHRPCEASWVPVDAASTNASPATPPSSADAASASSDAEASTSPSSTAGPASAGADADGAAPGARAGRGAGEWVPGFGAKANITVTIDFEDLKAATADATGRLVYGDAMSAAAIRRLACDAKIVPLVLGSNSEPLDVGRAERLVTRAMRRALNARDRGCVVCGAPPIQCEAHHLRHWIDGGVTAVSNMALLCRRHHTDLHRGHWNITITDGEVHVSRPAWADPPPLPRRPSAASPARSLIGTGATCDPPSTGAAARAERPRSGRWAADSATMQDAARFAVWGETPTSDPPAAAPSLPADSESAVTQHTTPFDPWGDVALV